MMTEPSRTKPSETAFIMGIVGLLLGVIYFPIMRGLFQDWSTNPDYSHGFIIPIAAAALIWHRRNSLRQSRIAPSGWGLVLLLLGAAQFSVGFVGAEHFLLSTSLLLVILGIVLYLYGNEIFRIVLVPVLFLIFMIPLPAIIWNNFAFSLKLFATRLAVSFMQLIGIVVLREGNVLFFPGATLEVVDACSGLRSLISLLALGVLIGFMADLPHWKKWVLFLCAIPIAILSNIIRLVTTAVLLVQFHFDTTQGIYHTISGLGVFFIGFLLFLVVYKLLTPATVPSVQDH